MKRELTGGKKVTLIKPKSKIHKGCLTLDFPKPQGGRRIIMIEYCDGYHVYENGKIEQSPKNVFALYNFLMNNYNLEIGSVIVGRIVEISIR